MAWFAHLTGRALLEVSGVDARAFLQGLITGDIHKITKTQSIYAALLTPQGKFLHDFFVAARGEGVALDAEAPRMDDLMRRLSLYKLRSKVEIARVPEREAQVFAVWEEGNPLAGEPVAPGETHQVMGGGIVFRDPRLAEAGLRVMASRGAALEYFTQLGARETTPEAYDAFRLSLGLPDGSHDIEVEKGLLLEYGIDHLRGVDFNKGCYVGQEVTARTRFRAQLRKALFMVQVAQGTVPPPGTAVVHQDTAVGEMLSGRDRRGLALLRIEDAEKALTAAGSPLSVSRPVWGTLPAAQNGTE